MNNYLLKDLLEIKNGKDHKHLSDGNIPVYGSGGIMRYGNDSIYDDESILLPRKGTLDNIQYVNKPFWTVDTIYYSVVDKKKANPYYLYNYLKLLDLSSLNSGTGVPSMTFGAYYDIEVTLPDLPTQSQIAKVLSYLDAKIELNNKINAELEAMAKLLYDYWFVQFDFPFDFAQGKPKSDIRPYKSSGGKMVWSEELKREIPEGWEVKELSEIVSCNKWTISKGSLVGKINYLDTSNLTLNKIDSLQVIDPEIEKIPNRAQRIVSANDILFSTVRPNQCHFGIIKKTFSNLVASSGFAQIRASDETISNDFLYYFLTSERTIIRLQQIADTAVSAYPSISHNDILALKICVPKDRSFLNEINLTLDSINAKMTNSFEENKKISNLRDWLLPMLMNGQVKVSEL